MIPTLGFTDFTGVYHGLPTLSMMDSDGKSMIEAPCLEVVRPRQAGGDRRVELRIFGDLVRDETRGLSPG